MEYRHENEFQTKIDLLCAIHISFDKLRLV